MWTNSRKVRASCINDFLVLEKSGVFKGVDESDPQNWGKSRFSAYFQQVDKDRDGLVTFKDFLGLFISHLNNEQIKNLIGVRSVIFIFNFLRNPNTLRVSIS